MLFEVAALALHIGAVPLPHPSCGLLPPARGEKLVVIGMSGGDSVSTVAVAGLDKPTTTGEIRIGPGRSKLRLVVISHEPMVVRLAGRVDRLTKIVVINRAGGGVIGVPSSKVHFSIGNKCFLSEDPQTLPQALGKKPDLSAEISNLYKGWTDGRTFRHEEAVEPEDGGARTKLAEMMDWLYTGGVVAIDPAKVISSGEVLPYSVLPGTAGALQLERSGALVEVERAEIEAWKAKAKVRYGSGLIDRYSIGGRAYRVTRPIEFPVGLCGSARLTFFVPSKEFVSGDPCHSDVMTLDGHILAPSYVADSPDCGSPIYTALAQPHAPGPLQLRTIHCVIFPGGQGDHYRPAASPDGKRLAFFPNFYKRLPLKIMEISGNALPLRDYAVTSTHYTNLGWLSGDPGYQWRSDSTGIWVARPVSDTETGLTPLTPLRPAMVSMDGSIKDLPELRHSIGPADGLLWIGGEGRAIARFRNPERVDKVTGNMRPPVYGMVDALTGTVLDNFEQADLERLRPSDPGLKKFFHAEKVVASQGGDGRLQALMDFGPWVLWIQGEEPRVARELPEATSAAMSADGKTVLMFRPSLPGEDNRTWFITCDGEGGRHGPCPERKAAEGTWASLHDVGTGKPLWALRWTFDRYDRLQNYALSSDGRLALIALISRKDHRKSFIGVVSMSDGKVLQTLPSPRSHFHMGFSSNGKVAWMITSAATVLYNVN